ncbi:MAG TPA: hypothetical protein VHV10_07395 [Ktedonobacteraceae bacterium]|jgi:hypothetical protein|nr:hypothetical protein [Ktedonobacteraceae bacterium]
MLHLDRFNSPMIPPSMENYLRRRVSTLAAVAHAQTMYQYELSKSVQLVGIEARYRTDLIKMAQKTRRP